MACHGTAPRVGAARPFLNTPYGVYLAREVPPPDDELVRVALGGLER